MLSNQTIEQQSRYIKYEEQIYLVSEWRFNCHQNKNIRCWIDILCDYVVLHPNLLLECTKKKPVASLWHLCHISQVQRHTHSGSVTMSKCKQLLVRFKSGRPKLGLLPACGSLLIRFNCNPHLKTVRRFCVVSIWWWFLFSNCRQWRHLNPILHLRPTQYAASHAG